MRIAFLTATGLATVALLAASASAFAQQVPAPPSNPPVEAPTPPASANAPDRVGPLFKLGTGLSRGAGYGGYSGLTLPLELGLEQQLAPGWSVEVNGASLWNIGQRSSIYSTDRSGLHLQGLSVGAGIRHYYNQEKRQAKGRRTGPYQGPYVALQLNNYLDRTHYAYDRQRLKYDYSTLTLQWGVQRRLGGRGLLDAYVGGGLDNQRTFRYSSGTTGTYQRKARPSFELGVKLSLTNK